MALASVRAVVLAELLVCVAYLAFGFPSCATALPVNFQGEVDSAGPLIIDPTAAADPVTTTLQTSSVPVYFIERMPQTKSVTSITLGDYGQGSCSSATPTARLYISSPDTNDYNGPNRTQMAITKDVALPQAPGRLTWTFDWLREGGTTLLMRAGRAYTFEIWITGCASFRQTTWAPMEPKFETPNDTCLSALPFGAGATMGARRVWHDALTPPNVGCVRALTDNWSYYPDGWLVSVQPGSTPYVDMIQNWGGLPTEPYGHYCESRWAGRGVSQVNVWVPTATGSEYDGVCRWDNYYPPGRLTRYAWSTALPLLADFNGGPRLPYLRLEVVDWSGGLLQRFRPVLKYDSRETYFAQSVDGLESLRLMPPSCDNAATSLNKRQDGDDVRYAVAADAGCGGFNVFVLGNLMPDGAAYPYTVSGQSPLASGDDYLDLRGDSEESYQPDSQAIMSNPAWSNKIYGRAYQGPSGELWLQYYFFYYYNNGRTIVPGADDHEGDWEAIQVHIANPFAASPVADRVTYNEHKFRSVCDWGVVQKSDGHPVVYVSRTRHASYLAPDVMPNPAAPGTADETDATYWSRGILPDAVAISAYTPAWVRWSGRWGASDGTGAVVPAFSPTGPASMTLWKDPAGWDGPQDEGGVARDVACPTTVPPANASRSDHDRRGRYDRRGDGRAPKMRIVGLTSRTVTVRWSVMAMHAGMSHRAATVTFAVRSTSKLWPARSRFVKVGKRRSGRLTLPLPAVKGPYEIVADSASRSGRTSSQARLAVGVS